MYILKYEYIDDSGDRPDWREDVLFYESMDDLKYSVINLMCYKGYRDSLYRDHVYRRKINILEIYDATQIGQNQIAQIILECNNEADILEAQYRKEIAEKLEEKQKLDATSAYNKRKKLYEELKKEFETKEQPCEKTM